MLYGRVQGPVVNRSWLRSRADKKVSVEPTTLSQGRAVLGSGFDLGQDQAANNTEVEPIASLSSVSTCLVCHRPPQLNHCQDAVNEVGSSRGAFVWR